MYYDAHTHLNDDALYPQREQHLSDFIAVWWQWLVCIGVDAVWNTRAIHIAQQSSLLFPSCIVKAAIGLHPSEISYEQYTDKDMIDRAIVILEDMIIANKDYVVAVGECGMDAHYENFQQHKLLQRYLFEQQCMLARRHALPLVIHSRDAFDETMEVLEHYTDLKIYMHCRSYSVEQLTLMIARFPKLRIWFCGNVTYPKAQQLRDALLVLVNSTAYKQWTTKLLLETDAPRLSPQTIRGKQNAPVYLKDIYDAVQCYIGIEYESLQYSIRASWMDLYII